MYDRMPTGLAPDAAQFEPGRPLAAVRNLAHNALRPEALESFWYLWRLTGREEYREWGWTVFKAFRKWCRTKRCAGRHSVPGSLTKSKVHCKLGPQHRAFAS